jgi:beta-phosphoglucomutase
MLQAVIFDFDGVICDSEGLHYKALNTVFNRYGVDVPKPVHWAKYLGFSDIENIEAVNHDYGMGLDAAGVRRLMGEKKAFFEEVVGKESIILEGVEPFIRRLTAAGVCCAICSGALRSDIDLMLAGADFTDAFEVIISAEDVRHGKPDPEGYLLTLKKLNKSRKTPIKPSECIVIEDSHWGLEAAAAAGMNPVAVTTTYRRDQLDSKAKKIVDRLDELTVNDLKEICLS